MSGRLPSGRCPGRYALRCRSAHRTWVQCQGQWARLARGIGALAVGDTVRNGFRGALQTRSRGGAPELVVPAAPFFGWSDFAFDPTTGLLYGYGNLARIFGLYIVDPVTGETTELNVQVGVEGNKKLAFDATGRLFQIVQLWDELFEVDLETGQIVSRLPIDEVFYQFGMSFGPNGALYVVDGGDYGTDTLYRLNTSTGALGTVGHTGLSDGLTSLAYVPEPGTLLLLGAGVMTITRSRLIV